MKCPLSRNTLEEGSYPPEQEFMNCLEQECAWWDEELKGCCIKSISHELSRIEDQLNSIDSALPTRLSRPDSP